METWYVLEDGDVVDPNDVAPDESGRLVHKSGVKVAMKGSVPHSRGVDVSAVKQREVSAERPKRTYKNREMKAD